MKKIIQRLLAAAASAAMLSSLALPSFAADPGKRFGTPLPAESGDNKITLTEHEGVKPTSDPHFGAYQIFTGTMSGPNQHPTNPGDIEKTEPAAGTEALQGIEFGNAFGTLDKAQTEAYAATVTKIENFVIALANASNGTGDYAEYQYAFSDFKGFENFVDADTGKLKTEYYNEDGSTLNLSVLAKAVAEVVAAHNSREWLEEFCDIALGFGHSDPSADEFDVPGFVNQYYPFTSSTDDAGTTTWSVTLAQSGYYMVVDMSNLTAEDEDKDKAFSARMLLVAGTVTQDLKESVPEIEKQVKNGETWGEEVIAGVGETVEFQITGTLPSNYDLFAGGYQYAFHDELDEGLKLNPDSLTIAVEGLWKDTGAGTGAADPDTWEWDAAAKKTITKESYVKDTVDSHSPHIGAEAYTQTATDSGFDIQFPCLKEIYITEGDTHYMLGCSSGGKEVSKITVSYSATVTLDAVIKSGNLNTAYLEYSDNPQAYDETDTTTKDTATVYTLGLDITKVDGTKFAANGGADGSTLAGIKFALLRTDADGNYQIATFGSTEGKQGDFGETDETFYYSTIVNWLTLPGADAESLSGLEGEKLSQKLADLTKEYAQANHGDSVIATDEQGRLLISGLDDELTYTLVEVETLPGYKLAKPFQFSYKAPESGGELALEEDTSCAVSGDEAMSYDKFIKDTTLEGTIEGDDDGDGAGDLLMANFNVADLPATGGMGNSIYYIIGCGALVLAGVMFVLSRKKSARVAS